jgi:hypothetical protein
LGLVLTCFGGCLVAPLAAAMCVQLRRIEGPQSPLAFAQLGFGFLQPFVFIFPVFPMLAASFRPERDPSSTLALHDLGWLVFVGAFFPVFFQCLAIAICILRDPEERVFPRWFAYYQLFMAMIFLPDVLIYSFKTGPVAWNGVISFWLVLVVYCVWVLLMFFMLRRAIRNEAVEASAPSHLQPEPV